jgi:hypothetical protein
MRRFSAHEDADGNKTSDLLFRTSPGQLYPTSQNSPPYTHAVIHFDRAPDLEAHVGVKVQGGSGVLHECDVLVLPAEEADISRGNQIAPRGSRCLLAIECKYYTNGLGLELARNFEGLHADLRSGHELFVANADSTSVFRYLSRRQRRYERCVVPGTDQVSYLCSSSYPRVIQELPEPPFPLDHRLVSMERLAPSVCWLRPYQCGDPRRCGPEPAVPC